jgi:hypothetical protein
MKTIYMTAGLALSFTAASANGSVNGSETQFRLSQESAWGGQTLVTPRAVYCATLPTAKFQVPFPKATTILYGAVPTGDAKSKTTLALAVVQRKGKPARVYLDANNDKVLAATESQELKPGAVNWPLCRGKASAVLNVDYLTADRSRLAGQVVVWPGETPSTLFLAWRGFLQGKLPINGKPRTAFFVDGNGNGVFGENDVDQLWIDLNSDARLDIVQEEFAVAPIQRWGARIYSLSLSPNTRKARLRGITGGPGKARITFDDEQTSTVKTLAATLISQTGDVAAANAPGQEIELPTGKYHISSLTLEMASPSAEAWTYAFSRWVDSRDEKEYPLQVNKGAAAEIVPFRKLVFDARIEGDKTPGGTLRIEFSAKSEMNLELTEAIKPGTSSSNSEQYARVELLNPEGQTVATATSGFS